MGVVMQVISSGGGKGAAGLSRYVAERDRDPEKEGKEPRPLFSKDRDGMTYRQADRILGQGKTAPEKDEIIHFVISLRPSDYERLGETDAERREKLVEAVREGMEGVAKDLGVKDIDWIAGVHLNTDNPHVHIGMNKNMVDAETGRERRIETIPMNMRGEPERAPDSGRSEGGEGGRETERKVVARFNEALEKRSEPITHIGFKLHDRDVLLRREIVPAGREATPNEITVGRWILLEVDPTTNGDAARETRREYLYGEVRRMDRESRSAGTKYVAAYIPLRELDEALAQGQIRAVKADRTQHRPFEREREPEAFAPVQPGRDEVLKERTTLGNELSVRLRAMHLSRLVEMAEQQGETRGYMVVDTALNVERRASVSDLEGRANARSGRLARETETKTSAERVEARREYFRGEMAGNSPALRAIAEQHAEQVQALNGMLDKALDQHDRLLSQASRIERRYRAEGRDVPTPIIERRTLERLHDQAVDRRDLPRLKQLEELRCQQAKEFGGERRNDVTAARLFAQHEIAEQDARVSGRRVENFERTSHLRKFEIGGEKLSLSDVDRDTRNKESEAKYQERRAEFYEGRLSLFGNVRNPFSLQSFNPATRIKTALTTNPLKGIGQVPFGPTLNPLKRAEFRREAETARQAAEQARLETERLQTVRAEVQKRIEAHRAELTGQHDLDKQVAQTLGEMRHGERLDRALRGASVPEPKFSAWELHRMESNAAQLRDGQVLRDYETLARAEGADPERMAARALGREIAAGVNRTNAEERLSNFIERRERTPVQFTDREGVERTASLREFSPRTMLERASERILGTAGDVAFNRDAINDALNAQEQSLESERAGARAFHEATKEIADGYRSEFQALGRELPNAEFTRQEMVSIERYAVQLTDAGRREQLTDLVRNAFEDGRVDNSPLSQRTDDRQDFRAGNEPEQSWRGPEQTPGRGPDLGPSEPSPGPDSITVTPGASSAAAAPEAVEIEMPIVII